ncbi:MAG: PilZ domain-containing protein [Thalassotalea sp.]
MEQQAQQDKLSQFTEFFTIAHNFSVNIEKLPVASSYSQQTFEQMIPLPFQLASDNITIDQKALRPIQNLSAHAHQLVEYLHHQANKIDLLVNYILSQHDDEALRFQGVEFGGGGFSFLAEDEFEIREQLAAKIFMLDNNCAVYCHGEIIDKTIINNEQQQYSYKVIFENIREVDREIMVRSSLHIQSKQLQELAQKRNQAAKE